MLQRTPGATAVAVLAAMSLFGAAGADSTGSSPAFNVPIRNTSSLIGSANNEKTCRYHSSDKRIHCVYDDGTQTEHVADNLVEPDFPAFGRSTEGSFQIPEGAEYVFVNGEFEARITGEDASTTCRLALQFVSDARQGFWIWHDELRFDSEGHSALIDGDGDGVADLVISGEWNGSVNGTRKWWTPNPYDGSYSAALRDYPARPSFASVDGHNRACKATEARLAVIGDASANLVGEVPTGWTGPLDVQTGF